MQGSTWIPSQGIWFLPNHNFEDLFETLEWWFLEDKWYPNRSSRDSPRAPIIYKISELIEISFSLKPLNKSFYASSQVNTDWSSFLIQFQTKVKVSEQTMWV